VTSYAEVEELVLTWPETTSTPSYGGFPALRVNRKFIARLRGEMADHVDDLTGEPHGEVLVVMVSDLGEKEAILADDPEVFFTLPHYDGHASVLVRLDRVDPEVLRELLLGAWLLAAPKRAQHAWVDRFGPLPVPDR
jgi:hypothetical protein